jgi:ATP-dependent DNA helicase RecG
MRSHDGDRDLTSYEIQALIAARGQPRNDLQIVDGATVDDLDPDLVAALVERLRETRGPVFAKASDADVLRFVQVLDRDRAADHVTLAGLLALGRYPQQFFPQLDITFVAFPTTEPGVPMSDGTRFLDNASLDGPIPLAIIQALAIIRRNMTRRAVIRGAGRQDHWDYPEEALRELLGNALIHRDYHPLTHGTQVRVELYPDRLEITSPGGLYGDVPPSALLREAVSSSRNATLAKLLEDVVYPGTNQTVCENRGTGLLAVSAMTRQEGLAVPELNSQLTHFRVTLRNGSSAPVQSQRPPATATAARPQPGRKTQILEILASGPTTTASLAEMTGLKLVTVRAHIRALEIAGLVEPTEVNKRSPANAWRLKR